MNTWVFGNAKDTIVLCNGVISVMWDKINNQPRDMDGYYAQLWLDDGSPTPEPHPST